MSKIVKWNKKYSRINFKLPKKRKDLFKKICKREYNKSMQECLEDFVENMTAEY